MFIYLCICLYLCNRCTCIHTHIAQFICIYEDKFTYLKLCITDSIVTRWLELILRNPLTD